MAFNNKSNTTIKGNKATRDRIQARLDSEAKARSDAARARGGKLGGKISLPTKGNGVGGASTSG